MHFKKSESIELKRELNSHLNKEVIAMANGTGGHIYIGVEEDGTVVGIDNSEEILSDICNSLRNTVKPDITLFTHNQIEEIEGKAIIDVEVQRGSKRPYFLAKKGLKPEGVYVRYGPASVPASDRAISEMIEESDGDSYETKRSLIQELTFNIAKKIFEEEGISFEKPQQQMLGMISPEGLYTNLALLLSDQCPFSIQLAVFNGIKLDIFQAREEYTGSLFKHMEDAYKFIDTMVNDIQADYQGLHRFDHRIYPELALREALINAVVHRDYSIHASIQIRVSSDRLEIISPGGLPSGKTEKDLFNGVSICRNEKLAGIFFQLKLIDVYGTGLEKILQAYEGTGKEPGFELTPNGFTIILPKLDYLSKREKPKPSIEEKPLPPEETILSLLEKNRSYLRSDIETLTQYKRSTLTKYLKSLLEKGKLVKIGNGRNTRYRLSN